MSELRNDSLKDLDILFVHSSLDDLGLSMAEFRIYAHLARRGWTGAAFPSIETIAEKCGCHQETAREAVQHLTAYGMITREDRTGKSCIYRLTKPTQWKPHLVGTFPSKRKSRNKPKSPTPPERREGYLFHTPPERMEGYPSGKEVGDPSGKEVDEGTPLKEIHLRKSISLSVPFKQAWCEAFEQRFGKKYLFNGGKDGNAVKNLMATNLRVEELMEHAMKAWNLPAKDRNTAFLYQQSLTIAGFASRFNEIQLLDDRDRILIPD